MSNVRNEIPDLFDRLQTFVEASQSGSLTPDQLEELEDLLRQSEEAQALYVELVELSVYLPRALAGAVADSEEESGFGGGDSGLEVGDLHVPNLQISKSPNLQIPLSPLPSPLSTPFVGGPVFSYIAATLILGVMLLGAWAYKISHGYGPYYVKNIRGLTAPGEPAQRPELLFVARVTGMKDCRWSDPATETCAGAYVPLGRKYALSSGLMEITYLSGAKVILEGPCSYKVESAAGGFLALGKLTARVESGETRGLAASAASAQRQAMTLPSPFGRGAGGEDSGNQNQSALTLILSGHHEVVVERGPDSSPKPQALRPKTEISKSPKLQISKFTVHTPTAVVTDLGTEFGVEVAANGDTTSKVFQGSINVRVAEGPAASAASDAGQITLAAGQSARVQKDANTGASRITTGEEIGAPPQFVRAIPQTRRGYLDLADIVAGGDGFGRARGRGIDSSTGAAVGGAIGSFGAEGDGRYHRVMELPLVDGVFVPDGGRGPVQLDSAGNVFAEFPDTGNFTWGYVWSGEYPKVKEDVPSPIAWLGGVNYSRPPHSALCMPTNKGITFDLEAVRRANERLEIKRFIAVAGNTEQRTLQGDPRHERVSADVWVFVDGRLRFGKKDFNVEDGPIPIDIPLKATDRFLTLATTDAGNTADFDWTMFGDPRLEISETIENRKEAQTPQP